jgi:aspartyl-tRNA(Asn)/glutamyl-tRNA(Gln) amidotransferase subunit C
MTEKLSDEQVRHVAKLSRLKLSDAQVQHFAGQLSSVLEYISKLNELDVDEVEPMAHAADVVNVLRVDQPGESLSVAQALANAPEVSEPFFKVPKVLGGQSEA